MQPGTLVKPRLSAARVAPHVLPRSAAPAAQVACRGPNFNLQMNRRQMNTIVRASENGDGEGGDGADASGSTVVMSMADSLLERAKEVATSGVADESFRETYVQELEAELAALRDQAAGAVRSAAALEDNLKLAKDQFVRLTADFENFRKRTAAERDALRAAVKGDTVLALIPLVDNFELAKSQLKLETEGERRVDAAYQGLYKQMVEAFRGLGLEAVPGAGAPFDPEVHEAIMREPCDDVAEGTVLEEFRKGFRIGDRLLRPAMVKVSYSEGAPPPAAEEDEEEEQGGADSASGSD